MTEVSWRYHVRGQVVEKGDDGELTVLAESESDSVVWPGDVSDFGTEFAENTARYVHRELVDKLRKGRRP